MRLSTLMIGAVKPGWAMGIKEKVVLEMLSENRQCQGRRNMGG